MKVKELIKKLEERNPDDTVIIYNDCANTNLIVEDIYDYGTYLEGEPYFNNDSFYNIDYLNDKLDYLIDSYIEDNSYGFVFINLMPGGK